MAIKYASLINSKVSTEGANGIMTNYTYYTILVVNTDGSRQIVEGKYGDVKWLLPYIRTPIDEMEEMKKSIAALERDVNQIVEKTVEQKLNYVIDSLFPIPNLMQVNEDEAVKLVKEAGLLPKQLVHYPDAMPHHGVVTKYQRSSSNFKVIELYIVHPLPKTENMAEAEAVSLLEKEGFTVSVKHVQDTTHRNGAVISCTREKETDTRVCLTTAFAIPEVTGMDAASAEKALQDAGCTVSVEKKYDNQKKNTVVKWISKSEKKIHLIISAGASVMAARQVHINWDNLPDSTGDTYEAKASYNASINEIDIEISYLIHSKGKHNLADAKMKSFADEEQKPWVLETLMTPGEKGEFSLHIPCKMAIGELPADASVTLILQQGLFKKTTEIGMSFTFEW